MKTVLTLTKVRLLALFSSFTRKAKKSNGSNRVALTVLTVALVVFLSLVFLAMGAGLAFVFAMVAFSTLQAPPLYFAMMAALALLLMIFTGMFTAKGELFEPKDNEMLLAMPIHPYQILLSRMTGLYLSDLLFEAFILLPAFVIWFFFAKVTILGALCYLLGALLLPLLALTVSSVFGYLLALVSSKFKNKAVPQTVLGILFLVLYFAFMSKFETLLNTLVENADALNKAFRTYLYPLYAWGQGCDGQILPFLAFLLICLLPFALCLYLLSRSFFKFAASSSTAKRIAYRKEESKSRGRSVVWAFACKEIKRLVSCSAYMLNGAMSMLMLSLIGIALLFKGRDLVALFEVDASVLSFVDDQIVAMFAAPLAFLIISTTVITSASISLEAKTLWIPLTSPVSPRTFLHAKTLAQVVICAPFVLFFGIVASIALKANIAVAIFVILSAQLFSVLCAQVGTLANLHFPKFDWPSETIAIKQSFAPLLTMLVCFGLALLFTAIMAVLGFLISPVLGLAVASVLLLIACVVLYLIERASGPAFARLLSHS